MVPPGLVLLALVTLRVLFLAAEAAPVEVINPALVLMINRAKVMDTNGLMGGE